MKNSVSTRKTSSGKIKAIMTLQKKRSVKWKTWQKKQPKLKHRKKKIRKNKKQISSHNDSATKKILKVKEI